MASSSPPPSSSSSPQPSGTSPPPKTQPNAISSSPPPPSSPPPAPSAPPPSPASPPPSPPTSPPPTSPPPTSSPPPLATNSTPPASPLLPSPNSSSPPPSAPPPAPTLSPPPPTSAASPPPPTPAASPPPPTPAAVPPVASPPAPLIPLTPPPAPLVSSPPPNNRPPITVPPPSPAKPLAAPPSSSPPPALAGPPTSSPPPQVPDLPPPVGSKTPPLTPSAPPPKTRPPIVPSPPSPPPPTNYSSSAPSPPIPSGTPPLSSPTDSSGNVGTPSPPGRNKSSSAGTNVTAGSGSGSLTEGGGIKTGTAVAIALVSALVVLSLVGIAVWFVRKKKKPAGGHAGGYVMPSPFASSQMSESSYPRSPTAPLMHQSSGSHGFIYSPSEPGIGNSKSWFTYEELSAITNGFSTQNLLGEGGFGCVYKGCLQDGREVAVKQLKVGGGQGEREFRAEVEIISRIHHRHLVSLVGYCIAEDQRLLVYDYVPNNTLHYHLHGQGRPVLDWATRVKVAAGAARGLAYLHEDCHPRIIHRDIKSSNILLDNNFEAQVSDFGLARLSMDAWTHVTTRVMGTFGYLAPEYASSGKLTDKSDVFSFGVVLLELITGRKPVDASQPLGDESLVEWARPLLSHALETGDLGDLPDPCLEKKYNESEMFRMIEAAAACVRHSAAMRPRMGQVLRALESLADTDLNNGIIPGQSELFSAAQRSADIRLFQRMAFGSQTFSTDFSQTGWNSWRDL